MTLHAGDNPFLAYPGQRERLEKAMKGTDETIAQFERNPKLLQSNPKLLESSYTGAASMACMLGDGAKAARYYAKITEAKNRESVARTCEQAHATLQR